MVMVTRESLVIRKHAAEEMAADNIAVADLLAVLNGGETIKSYPDDRPYPSRLVLAMIAGRPLHVVAALDSATGRTYAITAYEPHPNLWEADFKTRRKP